MTNEDRVLKTKICLVGDSCVGKTSLIRRYVLDEFDDKYISTLGAKISKKELMLPLNSGEYKVNMTVWDIMGEKGLTDLIKDSYFDGAGGVMVVCDMTRKDTLDGLDEWIMAADSVIGSVPMTFVGNKLDLGNEIELKNIELSRYADGRNSPYFLTSAKTGENVDAVFLNLARRVLTKSYHE